jgi:outer membrane protein TolC
MSNPYLGFRGGVLEIVERPRISLWRGAALGVFILLILSAAKAQSPSQMVTGPTRPIQLPLSGSEGPAQPGSVTVTEQTTNTGGGGAVNTINSSVNVQPPFNGSNPSAPGASGTLTLTLEKALADGLRYNLGVLSQASSVLQMRGQRKVVRSELLPNLNGAVSEEFERLNLRTMGVESPTFPESVKFNFYDARAARLQQTVFDLVKVENLRSASESLKASFKQVQSTRDLVVLAVGGSYLQLLATNARIRAAQAQVDTSRAIYQQAKDRFALGLASRIDVSRPQVQLQVEELRLRSLQADLETQSLRMARIIGLPLDQQFVAVDEFDFVPLSNVTMDEARHTAQKQRPDLQAATSAVKAAESAVKAARAERLPSLAVNADFGAAGITPSHESTGVYSVSGTLTIPLYEGGRIQGDIERAQAALRERQAELENLNGQVDQDVRQAFIDLGLAADQVNMAKSDVDLAKDILTQSRDRFSVGVADTVEVVQAEQTVVQADDDYITAIFQHNLAKVSLARALGNAEQSLPQLLRK